MLRLILSAALLGSLALCAGEPAAVQPVTMTEAQGVEFFEKKIRPVLVQSCYDCHSLEKGKSKGGLKVDSREAMLKGGESGPVLVAGNPGASLIMKAIRYGDQDMQMPPKQKLPDAVIADFDTWIRAGAPDPRVAKAVVAEETKPGISLEEGRAHWAFKPIADPVAPKIKDKKRAKNAVDNFLLSEIEKRKLSPAPEADKPTLLRRLSFDLTGLPPTPEELEAFLKDSSSDAFEKAVDRLLASPRYGERWGRHWLDLMRYADSNGVDEDVGHPHAWRYRDYVIRAFNDDKPYDRFITEQLAGDLLPNPDADAIVATSWLAMGPKMLAEPDLEKMKLDIADEQLDVASKTFLGLTISCARCHDHKFDPIYATDYYALAGIFRSTGIITDYSKRPAILLENVVPDPANESLKAEFQKKVEAQKAEIAAAEKAQPKDDKKLAKLKEELKKLEKAGPDLPKAMGVKEIEIRDLAVHLRGSHLNLAKEKTPRGFPKVLNLHLTPPTVGPKQSGRLELAQWLCDPKHPLTARVMVNRIWQAHFGEGLVRTPSNFGLKGEAPDNPALLDFLAQEFIRGGWSIKKMHRLILTSAAWRRSSVASAELLEKDPENRLFARQNRRRMEAEVVRDALLACGGLLDLKMGGFVEGAHRSSEYYKTKEEAYQIPRRTVYLPIPRHTTYELLTIFDYADTAVHLDKRPVTTVPQQALFMMNDPLVRKQAKALAQKLLQPEAQDRDRARQAWITLFSRPAGNVETKTVLAYVDRFMKQGRTPELAWTNVIHALMASNDFVFID